jgi:PTH1 family peptidyl-tRNA hydrolase
VANWVLKKPSPEQRDAIELGIERSLKAATDLVLGRMDKATVQIHTSKPPRPKPPRPADISKPPATGQTGDVVPGVGEPPTTTPSTGTPKA